ncbi:EF hand family protein [Trichomonas vaginalis G3]|uniref:EF hand family protein n=1 Tax=Trichomonas vaginalis (strain ATCC PRA-98 / G3) TaxID=412133 RepID=A2EAY1_TRIV3|nr:calcium-binding protein family [Trichomonas vaginalis G3]EAY10226.1 EF hand family protein [Trichomonas vaginalis G3]KAI5514014.1 calcium-binding protein family [Trichomonas vaginalis G3]|eukprot:XP_001322449.1 EF hand family protein [Trichomonas vaginalis G3]
MSDERIAQFEKKFDEMDTGKDGKMKAKEFNALYAELEGKECTQEESDVMFRGIDIDNSGTVTKEEFMDMVKAVVNNDDLYTYKLIFRAFDKDRSKALECKEVIAIHKYCGKEVTQEQVEKFMVEETGKKNGKITFAMLYKLLTGKKIAAETDPYDGKLKSKCCLLL